MCRLDPAARSELLALAREAIRHRLTGQSSSRPPAHNTVLDENRAIFVTLNQAGRLRGCVGFLDCDKPLFRSVEECAVAAAFDDPRFPPLCLDDLESIRLEISVLSALRRVADPTEIRVGTDGVLVTLSGRRGLLLPQVATEYHWDRETFLEQVCLKARLPKDAWRRDAVIEAFSAVVFGEEE